jgi:hypothetical protein
MKRSLLFTLILDRHRVYNEFLAEDAQGKRR